MRKYLEETVARLLHNIKSPVLDFKYEVKYSYHANCHIQSNRLLQTNNDINRRITRANTNF